MMVLFSLQTTEAKKVHSYQQIKKLQCFSTGRNPEDR